ncbi:MAG: hypothetical protein GX564_03050 [Oligosphaeraceae bacterium]|nr:hypothetical protein [Oligosphaeraceae bacterium]
MRSGQNPHFSRASSITCRGQQLSRLLAHVNDNSNWRQICHAGVPPEPIDYFGSESGFHKEKSAPSGASMWRPALSKNGADFDYHPPRHAEANRKRLLFSNTLAPIFAHLPQNMISDALRLFGC